MFGNNISLLNLCGFVLQPPLDQASKIFIKPLRQQDLDSAVLLHEAAVFNGRLVFGEDGAAAVQVRDMQRHQEYERVVAGEIDACSCSGNLAVMWAQSDFCSL